MTIIFTAIISVFGIILASFFTYLITKYQLTKTNNREFRMKWLSEILQNISELCEYASLFHHGENVVPMGADKHSQWLQLANSRRYKLQILLSPENKTEKEILDQIEDVIYKMFEGNANIGDNGSPLHKSINLLVIKVRPLFRLSL